jgi:hypothetical protein
MTMLLSMMSMMVTAQSFVVVDKNGKKTAYDVSKIDSVTFQNATPGFTLHEQETSSADGQTTVNGKTTSYNFADVQNISGDTEYIFANLDTVYVDCEGQDFEFKVRSSLDYNYKVSDGWLEYGSKDAETGALKFSATINPSTSLRKGYVALISSDEQLSDTVWVVQARKLDSRYIDIDWSKTTLNSFNEETGQASLTFTGDVPVMGDYDVVLLPKDGDYMIRVIDNVQQAEGTKTVNLETRQGVMGNLFKGTKFNLATEKRATTRSASEDVPTYLPTKVEVFTNGEYVEIFNEADAQRGRTRAPQEFENEFISWEYNDDGKVLWESGVQSLSWDKLNFSVGLKGLFSFDFGDIPWEKVRMGDLQNLKISLEGGFDMNLILKYAVASEVSFEKEWTLKENAIPNLKYTFMVGTIPVYITVGADLMAKIELGASGEASITTGVQASTKVNYGVEWDAEKGLTKIAECNKELELVGPDLDINAHAEARATAYPKIEIGIYKVLCPTISPQPYIKAEADGRLVDNSMVAWNAGVSTGIDLGLGLCLDLFFWKKDLGEIDPVNVFDQPLVSLPDEIELQNEKEEQMLITEQKEVKYHVTNKNYLTGTTYNAPGVLVHFEAEGGEISSEYDYTDAQGNVSVKYTPTAGEKGGVVKAEVVLGAEPEKEEDAMKADDYSIEAIDYRLTGGSYTIPEGETSVDVTFQLDRYSSANATWAGASGRTVAFTATNGTVSPSSGVTDANGKVTVTFTAGENFKEGSVTASVSGSDPSAWSKTSTATVKGEDSDDGITDEGLKKAAKQKENVYVIENKKTSETQERSYVTKWSEWNKDQDFINISLEDADADGGTLGMAWGHIPLSMADVVLALTGETFANTPGAKFKFEVYEGTQLSADFACFTGAEGMETMGNIKPESKIMLRKTASTAKARTRGGDEEEYTGDYELLFYLVFKNQTYNQETKQMEEGDEYEVYGRGTMKMHIPTITSFQLNTEDNWVKVGNSTKVQVTQYYEKNATWDWSDVELVGQSTSYNGADNENLGFFTWDASTQTLTSVKSNDNKDVYLKFALKSKPNVKSNINVSVGEGWKYTSFTVGPEEQEVGSGYCSYYVEDWTPKVSEDEKFDDAAIEIDPASDPEGNFSYVHYNGRYSARLYVYRTDAAPGEYNLRFRLKSDHSIGSTMKITIKEEE